MSSRQEEVVRYCELNGIHRTAEKFNITYETISRYRRHVNQTKRNFPKIFIFDIETTPLIGYAFRVWQENIRPEQIIEDWHMLSWAGKWLNDSRIVGDVLRREEVLEGNDKRISKSLYQMIDKADIVIAHNANKFDIKRMNTRFLANGITPPSHYKVVDTLRAARKHFGFSHNSLDSLAEFFDIPGKFKADFSLWRRCKEGDKKALKEMLEYNKQDVLVLEEVYTKLRGWIKGHPNLNLYQDTEFCCANCGSENLKSKGFYSTTVNQYEAFQCQNCGAISRKSKHRLQSISN